MTWCHPGSAGLTRPAEGRASLPERAPINLADKARLSIALIPIDQFADSGRDLQRRVMALREALACFVFTSSIAKRPNTSRAPAVPLIDRMKHPRI